ncbi:MAG: glycerol-3-phosphate 1-O-acyltransferase PlsY [Alphaproteobacteria bacterium]|jgi:glycerol-3-phosphate acyltransferase PlsY|nr:glycerol-3-phosphate 1-O-acyltransferase PlsY [Alphaproteobacteria bacterium]
MIYIILLILSYLLGSIPFGWLLIKMLGKGDIRNIGSGGTGATNVARVLGLGGFIGVWAFDMAKAAIAVWLGTHFISPVFGVICGLVAIIGHCFPIWLKFKGGKGNASMFGVLLAVNPLMFIVIGIEWLLVAITTKYSSLGAIVGFLVMPLLGFATSFEIGLVFIAISALCLFQHRENIKRLLSGTESKMQMDTKKLTAGLIIVGLLVLGLVIAINA